MTDVMFWVELPCDDRGVKQSNGSVQPCPDCPAKLGGVLTEMLPQDNVPCAFRCERVGARAPLPEAWFDTYGMALVRRGFIVRHRLDAKGRSVAVDVAGPGSLVPMSPIGESGDRTPRAFAVTESLLCLCPTSEELRWGNTLGNELLHLHRRTLDRVERLAEARGRKTLASRVATLLCTLADTLHPRPKAHVPSGLPQRTLSQLIDVRHESMCRALKGLQKKGWITRDIRGIWIMHRSALEAL